MYAQRSYRHPASPLQHATTPSGNIEQHQSAASQGIQPASVLTIHERIRKTVTETDYRETEEELRKRVKKLEGILRELEEEAQPMHEELLEARKMKNKLAECEDHLFVANTRLNELSEHLDRCEGEKKYISRQLDDALAKVRELQDKMNTNNNELLSRAAAAEDEKNRAQAKLADMEHRFQGEKKVLEDKLSLVSKDLEEYLKYGEDKDRRREGERNDLIHEISLLSEENRRLQKAVDELTARTDTHKRDLERDLQHLEMERDEARQRAYMAEAHVVSERNKYLADLDRARDEKQLLQEERQDALRRLQEAENRLQADKDNVKHEIERIHNEKKEALHWLQDMENKLNQEKAELKAQCDRAHIDRADAIRRMEEMEASYQGLMSDVDRANAERDGAIRRYREAEAALGREKNAWSSEVESLRAERDQCIRRIQDLEEGKLIPERRAMEAEKECEKLKHERNEARDKFDHLEKTFNDQRAVILNHHSEELTLARQRIDEVEHRLKKEEDRVRDLEAEKGKWENESRHRYGKINELETRLHNLQKEYDTALREGRKTNDSLIDWREKVNKLLAERDDRKKEIDHINGLLRDRDRDIVQQQYLKDEIMDLKNELDHLRAQGVSNPAMHEHVHVRIHEKVTRSGTDSRANAREGDMQESQNAPYDYRDTEFSQRMPPDARRSSRIQNLRDELAQARQDFYQHRNQYHGAP